LYPEYRRKLDSYKPPAMCTRYCNCTGLLTCNVTDAEPPRGR
jgi:hypothetical protein